MTLNLYADQQAILTQANSVMAQDVIEGLPDGVPTEWDEGNLRVVPYITVSFGSPVAAALGRSIAGEAKQPTEASVAFACVASDPNVARQISGKLVASMTGFYASTNAGPLALIGGAGYNLKLDNKPTVFVSEVYFRFGSNMADA